MGHTVLISSIYGGARRMRVSIPAGETSDPIEVAPGGSAVAIPGGGGTMWVEMTSSPLEAVRAGTANWIRWLPGTVSAASTDSYANATALRAAAQTAVGVLEIAS